MIWSILYLLTHIEILALWIIVMIVLFVLSYF